MDWVWPEAVILRLSALRLGGVSSSTFFAHVEIWTYRIGVFVILNVLDDPAWLAMIFC